MSIIRKVNIRPNYGVVESKRDIELMVREILKFKPTVEVTLAGGSEVAKGKIIEWFPNRHFFTVKFSQKSAKFDEMTEEDGELKAFFKAHLFSAQMVFKTVTVRRLDDEIFHYRIPDEFYKQQRRGALRVPVKAGSLASGISEYGLLDLSVTGARLKMPAGTSKIKAGTLFKECTLKFGKKTIRSAKFQARVASADGSSMGVRFIGLTEEEKTQIKQYLVDALKIYFDGIPR